MPVRKFIKKPIVIEAMQFAGFEHGDFIRRWSEGAVIASPVLEPSKDNPTGKYLQIKTPEGTMTAVVGDWIIKGVKGEFYPCKSDIFAATYEDADERRAAYPDSREAGGEGLRKVAIDAMVIAETCSKDPHLTIRSARALLADLSNRLSDVLIAATPPPTVAPDSPALEWRQPSSFETFVCSVGGIRMSLEKYKGNTWWLSSTGGVVCGNLRTDDLATAKAISEQRLHEFFTAGLAALAGTAGEVQ